MAITANISRDVKLYTELESPSMQSFLALAARRIESGGLGGVAVCLAHVLRFCGGGDASRSRRTDRACLL